MSTYITVADVDAILGVNWTTEDKKARAVLQANAYLTTLNLVGVDMDVVPEEVKQAGAEFAKVAAEGKLYQQKTEGSLEAKTVKAGSVTTSKTFASLNSSKIIAQPGDVQFALALLTPWRSSPFAFSVYR